MVFKVGDKVQYIKHDSSGVDEHWFEIGKIYTIKSICSLTIYVDNIGIHLNHHQVIKVTAPNNILSRTIYPNKKISECGKYLL